MPWTSADAKSHTSKANTPKLQHQWSDVANSAREKCISDGGDSKTCDQKAIMMANGVIAKLSEDGKSFYYMTEIDVSELKDLEDKTTITIDIFREGQWTHPKWGIIKGTKKLFADFIKNWKENIVGRDIILDKNHKPEDGGTGIVKDLFIDGDKLKAKVELTNFGIDLIKNKGFHYFSPEYTDKYVNKETGSIVENVLIGGALTLRPFLTNLSPVILSEQLSEDITLHQGAIAQNMPTDSASFSYLDLVNPFLDILRSLCYGGYVNQNDLKDFVMEHLNRVDFNQVEISMSEEFKKELIILLEEYLEKKG